MERKRQKSTVKYTFIAAVLLCLALLCVSISSPMAQAADTLLLERISLSCGGETLAFRFIPTQTSYSIKLSSAQTLTIEARGPEGCQISDDAGNSALTTLVCAREISEDTRIQLRLRQNDLQTLYTLTISLEDNTESGGEEDSGDDGSSGGDDTQSASGTDPPAGDTEDPQNEENGDTEEDADALPDSAIQDEEDEEEDRSPASISLTLYINAPYLLANDRYFSMDTSPYLVNDAQGGGYTMVPLRFIAEALGAEVGWDNNSKTVSIFLDGQSFQLVIGQPVTGTPVAATIRDSRTFVPLRYVMESFGASVSWNQKEQRIDVLYQPK